MILHGNCLDQLKNIEDNSLDSLVTDPPYGLSQITESDTRQALQSWLSGQNYEHSKSGFMGKKWDSFVPSPDVWREVYRVLKHGAHGVVFAGTRTQDLMSISLRLAGFEVRDTLMYLYGSGFPKSHNISLAIDKKLGHPNRGKAVPTASQYQASDVEEKNKLTSNPVPGYTAKSAEAQDYSGQGTALKPAYEPIILIRKPLQGTVADNVLQHGTGGLNIDDCRIRYGEEENIDFSKVHEQKTASYEQSGWTGHVAKVGAQIPMHKPKGRFPANVLLSHSNQCEFKGTQKIKKGKKNSEQKTMREDIDYWGQKKRAPDMHRGEENIEIWDCIESCPVQMLEQNSRFFYTSKASKKEKEAGLHELESKEFTLMDGGLDESLSYKFPKTQRKNNHPTVKPLDLMRYLIKLVSPKKGTVLDPFGGSGSTACAAIQCGRDFVLCEINEEYIQIIEKRIAHYQQEINNSLFRPEDF